MTEVVPVSIRRATNNDWALIWPIVSAVIATGDTYSLAPESTEQAAHAYWMAPGNQTYVAFLDKEIVGTYVLRANQQGLGSHVANGSYMVKPGRYGHGIGAALGEHSLAAARAAGFRAMQFNAVVSTNMRAVALWQRLGFVIVGTVPKAFRHRQRGLVDFHVMHRFL